MSRWRAASIHFSISLVVLMLLLAVILIIWYPGILFSVDGGWAGLRIVMGVDLILGPLLTLVVFKVGKPGLKFDLSCIAIAQVVCMSAGLWIVYSERPIALVLAYDTVYSLAAQDFEAFDKDPSFIAAFDGRSPKLLYVELPEDEAAAEIANIRSQFIGDPLYMQTDKYMTLPQEAEDIVAVFRRNDQVRKEVPTESLVGAIDACLYSKFVSKLTAGYVCFDPDRRALNSFFDYAEADN